MSRAVVKVLHCVGLCGKAFNVVIERESDLTMSHLTNAGYRADGYAVYRDKVLVLCPHCNSYAIEVIKR